MQCHTTPQAVQVSSTSAKVFKLALFVLCSLPVPERSALSIYITKLTGEEFNSMKVLRRSKMHFDSLG